MTGFNYNEFKAALLKVQEEKHAKLMLDIEHVKAVVEKALTMCFESSASTSRASYPGLEC